jgi:hypothetical protein
MSAALLVAASRAVETKLGDGRWKPATRLRPYRQDINDVRRRIVGGFVVDAR